MRLPLLKVTFPRNRRYCESAATYLKIRSDYSKHENVRMVVQIKTKLFFLALLFLVVSFHDSNQSDTGCHRISFRKHVRNVTFHQSLIEGLPQTRRLTAQYNITLKTEHCCPVLSFNNNQTVKSNHHIDTEKQCFKEGFQNIALLSHYFVSLKEWNPLSGCKVNGGYLICTGTRELYSGTESYWWIDIRFECLMRKVLDVTVIMDFECNLPTTCEKLESSYCTDLLDYNQTAFPNVLGHQSQLMAQLTFDTLLLVRNKLDSCYQFLDEFGCYSLYPKCINGRIVPPCHQACVEFTRGCKYYINKYNQPIYCGTFPLTLDPNICFYKPVTCPTEENPEFGRLIQMGRRPFNITEVFCNEGYQPTGDVVRHCMYSGAWNGTKPTCLLRMNSKDTQGITSLSLIILPCIVLVIMFVICKHYRKNISLLITYNCLRMRASYQVAQGGYSLFITYSSEDADHVQNEILPAMKLELPTWKIITFQEDFIGGDSLPASIHKAIWESTAVVAILTANYIESEWCIYEFQEAQTRSASDREFKFISILLCKNNEGNSKDDLINSLPEPTKTWIMGRVYLTIGERLFWNKLRRALAK